MKYAELVANIRELFGKADVSKIEGRIAYQFNVEGEAEGAFYAEISDGALSIEPYEYYDRDVLFTMTGETLLEIARGKQDAMKAFTEGKLKVEGDFEKALRLQEFAGQPGDEKDSLKKQAVKKIAGKVAAAKTAADKAIKGKAAAKTAAGKAIKGKAASKSAAGKAGKGETAAKTAADKAVKPESVAKMVADKTLNGKKATAARASEKTAK